MCSATSCLATCYTALVLGACPSSNPGDSAAPQCDAFCAVEDKAYDCGFCRCKACDFCGGGGGADGKPLAIARRRSSLLLTMAAQ